MRLFWFVVMLVFFTNLSTSAQTVPQLNLLPVPSTVQAGTGAMPITQSFSVALEGYKDPRLERAVVPFLRDVTLRTGLFVGIETVDASKATLVIHAERASKPVQELGEDESYVLDVSASGAKLSAPNSLGIMH